MIKNYLPTYVYQDIFQIDYQKLKNEGIINLFFDLDNTLLPYQKEDASEDVVKLIKNLRSMGFNCYLLSNSPKMRVAYFSNLLGCNGYSYQIGKPSASKAKKYLASLDANSFDSLIIGDQILTDILCANRLKLKSILVKSINRTNEPWYTKINRSREFIVISKLDKVDHEICEQIIKLTRN